MSNDAIGHPVTFYGVHKQACEGMARIFWHEEQVPSIGIRPVHRLRAGPRQRPHRVADASRWPPRPRARTTGSTFGGRTQLQYAPDTARVFIAAARAATEGARVFHLGGPVVSLAEVAARDRGRRRPTCRSPSTRRRILPFPEEFDGAPLDAALGGDRLDAARGRRQRDRRAAASRAGVSDESTANERGAQRRRAPRARRRSRSLASRIAPSTSGEIADSE